HRDAGGRVTAAQRVHAGAAPQGRDRGDRSGGSGGGPGGGDGRQSRRGRARRGRGVDRHLGWSRPERARQLQGARSARGGVRWPRRGGRVAGGGGCRLAAARRSGGPDREDGEPHAVHRGRDLRRDPTPRRDAYLEGDRRDQQGQRRADLQGGRLRGGGSPVRGGAEADGRDQETTWVRGRGSGKGERCSRRSTSRRCRWTGSSYRSAPRVRATAWTWTC